MYGFPFGVTMAEASKIVKSKNKIAHAGGIGTEKGNPYILRRSNLPLQKLLQFQRNMKVFSFPFRFARPKGVGLIVSTKKTLSYFFFSRHKV